MLHLNKIKFAYPHFCLAARQIIRTKYIVHKNIYSTFALRNFNHIFAHCLVPLENSKNFFMHYMQHQKPATITKVVSLFFQYHNPMIVRIFLTKITDWRCSNCLLFFFVNFKLKTQIYKNTFV